MLRLHLPQRGSPASRVRRVRHAEGGLEAPPIVVFRRVRGIRQLVVQGRGANATAAIVAIRTLPRYVLQDDDAAEAEGGAGDAQDARERTKTPTAPRHDDERDDGHHRGGPRVVDAGPGAARWKTGRKMPASTTAGMAAAALADDVRRGGGAGAGRGDKRPPKPRAGAVVASRFQVAPAPRFERSRRPHGRLRAPVGVLRARQSSIGPPRRTRRTRRTRRLRTRRQRTRRRRTRRRRTRRRRRRRTRRTRQ